jgi:hypothetical protein
LARSEVVEDELAARVLVDFGSDTVADDWHHRISPKKIITLAMKRLEAHGKGICCSTTFGPQPSPRCPVY